MAVSLELQQRTARPLSEVPFYLEPAGANKDFAGAALRTSRRD
jgi:hypothetical protein